VRVLGLSAFDRDATAALVAEGRAVAASAEERFTRQCHDPNFPRFAAEWVLREAGLPASRLDAIAFADDPGATFSRVLVSALQEGFPFQPGTFAAALKPWLASRLWIRDGISRRLDVHPDLVHFVPRARAMIANAALAAAPADGAPPVAVLVIDTAADWPCTTLAKLHRENGRLRIDERQHIAYPHSLGLFVSAFAGHAGFRVGDEEAAFLALAPFGDALLAERVRRVLRLGPDGAYALDPRFFRFSSLEGRVDGVPWTSALVDLFGPPRDARRPWPFDPRRRDTRAIDPEDKRFADLAASVRVVLDAALVALAQRARDLARADTLALAGSLFSDPALVAVVERADPRPVVVPPDPGPGGTALGAAAIVSEEAGSSVSLRGADLGRAWDGGRDLAALKLADPRYWQRFRRRGASPVGDMRVAVDEGQSDADLVRRCTAALRQGAAVGWVRGRFAVGRGPDAGRCVLVDPSDEATVARLRASILGLHPVLPLAVGVPRDAMAAVVLDAPIGPDDPPWRTRLCRARADCAALSPMPSATGDLLVLPLDEDSPLAAIARALDPACPAVGIAPLAEDGWPPAASPADALLVFMRTDLDHLVIDQAFVAKEYPCPTLPTDRAPAAHPSSP
jgi:carbamoyltransferase